MISQQMLGLVEVCDLLAFEQPARARSSAMEAHGKHGG